MNIKILYTFLILAVAHTSYGQQDSFFKTMKPIGSNNIKSVDNSKSSIESLLSTFLNPQLMGQMDSMSGKMVKSMTQLMNDPEVMKSINTLNEKFMSSMGQFSETDSFLKMLFPQSNSEPIEMNTINNYLDSMLEKRNK